MKKELFIKVMEGIIKNDKRINTYYDYFSEKVFENLCEMNTLPLMILNEELELESDEYSGTIIDYWLYERNCAKDGCEIWDEDNNLIMNILTLDDLWDYIHNIEKK